MKKRVSSSILLVISVFIAITSLVGGLDIADAYMWAQSRSKLFKLSATMPALVTMGVFLLIAVGLAIYCIIVLFKNTNSEDKTFEMLDMETQPHNPHVKPFYHDHSREDAVDVLLQQVEASPPN